MKRILALVAITLASLGSLTSASAAAMANTVQQQKIVGAYRLTLQVGPAEAMSMHPKGNTGERMIGGKMASCSTQGGGMGGMSMGPKTCNHHIEIHIVNRRTGKVITNAHVTIRLAGVHTHAAIVVPIMTMVGARHSMSDFHYGNNIYAPSGPYRVTVQINGTTATFAVNLR